MADMFDLEVKVSQVSQNGSVDPDTKKTILSCITCKSTCTCVCTFNCTMLIC
ncbi:TPA: FDLD family class I lanthipeptide [Bacillus cereus]|nr:FDLD family class I lanthipeptide [Bacillus cereus]HDR4764817.1 FDLD family class I lanthipeptide [Bacillus cereus]HDR4797820.1 FDLD family class I lanthipeptide [Bacillus cereus]HDR4803908.1 FDLD family class I lanthipeptide [Bacillus cereus]HDR4809916.1 FDLD family class I lanthipeptide [Bacillus cereus]